MTRLPNLALATLVALAGCTSYSFAQKTPDGQIYVNGSYGFLWLSSHFIERCTEAGAQLTCQRLAVVKDKD
jgi:hypothetical protein